MRCRVCGGQACVDVKRSNTAFCADCYQQYFQRQVARAIKKHDMLGTDDRPVIAVSGGKDSLTLWQVLLDMGYRADGLHLNLGIGEYSVNSQEKAAAFAESRGVKLITIGVAEEYGYGIPQVAKRTARSACSACGLIKRYLLNKVALERGFNVLVTGHNLDDEAAALLGNLLRWQSGYLLRQSPVLPSTHPKLLRRVKPLFRLTEREIAAYGLLRGVDWLVDECPLAAGAATLRYKEVLNQLEADSPGTKHHFYFGFLEKGSSFAAASPPVELRECARCGQPTTTEVCAFCRLWEQVKRDKALPVT
ncbi:MAG TPA: TIGR00269 family protein [Dehalococcoidia bacterium]|nr:TIGR00269 family protein [Dehalococcoidia bacterium]